MITARQFSLERTAPKLAYFASSSSGQSQISWYLRSNNPADIDWFELGKSIPIFRERLISRIAFPVDKAWYKLDFGKGSRAENWWYARDSFGAAEARTGTCLDAETGNHMTKCLAWACSPAMHWVEQIWLIDYGYIV